MHGRSWIICAAVLVVLAGACSAGDVERTVTEEYGAEGPTCPIRIVEEEKTPNHILRVTRTRVDGILSVTSEYEWQINREPGRTEESTEVRSIKDGLMVVDERRTKVSSMNAVEDVIERRSDEGELTVVQRSTTESRTVGASTTTTTTVETPVDGVLTPTGIVEVERAAHREVRRTSRPIDGGMVVVEEQTTISRPDSREVITKRLKDGVLVIVSRVVTTRD